MNYIRHLNGVLEKFATDERLRPTHISLYLALFQMWNAARFQNPLSINRTELMQVSKIGSANTYTDCLKELHAWGYVEYIPSFNPTKGSLVNLYSYDKGAEQAEELNLYSFHKGSNKGTDTGSDKGDAIALRPSINSINYQTDQTLETIQTGVAHAWVDEKLVASGLPGSSAKKEAKGFGPRKEKMVRRTVAAKRNGGSVPPEKSATKLKEGQAEIVFAESEYADIEKFRQAFAGTNFEAANLDFYYEAICNWRDKKTGDPPQRKDWLSTARTFMLNDYKEGKLVIQPTITDAKSHHPNGNSAQSKAGKASISLDAIFAITAVAHSKK
jgi:hypothetical protein